MRRSRVITDSRVFTSGGGSRAFTLVELLVVIGIIAVLIGLLVPVLSRARKASRQTVALSAMRDVLFGYSMYVKDHRGTLMWGYPPAYIAGQEVRVGLPTGQELPTAGSGTFGSMSLPIQRYPARLAPYQHSIWELLYNHLESAALPQHGDTIDEAARKIYEIALYPSFGLNSAFMGGDQNFDGFPGSAPNQRPNFGKHCAFKATEIKHPSDQLVFVECQEITTSGRTQNGFFNARPPVAKGRRWWRANPNGDRAETASPGAFGVPYGRWSSRAVTGFFDGHAATLTIAELDDMRIWAKDAKTADYDYQLP